MINNKNKRRYKLFNKYILPILAIILAFIPPLMDSCTNVADKFGITPSIVGNIPSEKKLFTISPSKKRNFEFKIVKDEWFGKQVDCCTINPSLNIKSQMLFDEVLNCDTALDFEFDNTYESLEMVVKAISLDGHTMTIMIFRDEAFWESYELYDNEYTIISMNNLNDTKSITFVVAINENTKFDQDLNYVNIMDAKLYSPSGQ